MSEFKKVEVGIYKLEHKVWSTSDERHIAPGSTIACFFPLAGSHVFGVDQASGTVKAFSKQNLILQSVINVEYESEVVFPSGLQIVNDTWAKLNAICAELRKEPAKQKPLHTQKNLHAIEDRQQEEAEALHSDQIHLQP